MCKPWATAESQFYLLLILDIVRIFYRKRILKVIQIHLKTCNFKYKEWNFQKNFWMFWDMVSLCTKAGFKLSIFPFHPPEFWYYRVYHTMSTLLMVLTQWLSSSLGSILNKYIIQCPQKVWIRGEWFEESEAECYKTWRKLAKCGG
jgi:hypothetical protein